MLQGQKYSDSISDNKDLYWMRVMHFESRYWSIDQLLKTTAHQHIRNFLPAFRFED